MEPKLDVGDAVEAEAQITDLLRLRADGGPNRMEEALEIAREWGLDENEVWERFEEVELALREKRAKPEKLEVKPATRDVNEVKPKPKIVEKIETAKIVEPVAASA